MNKKAQTPFMYLKDGEILYDSEGMEAMAKKEAENIIKTIREISLNKEDTRDNDIIINDNDDSGNIEDKEIDLINEVIAAFKDGPIKGKPSIKKEHVSSVSLTSSLSEKTKTEDIKLNETHMGCQDAAANLKADAQGHINFYMGEKFEVKANYNAKVNASTDISCLGLSDKKSEHDENERELKIAHCSAKGEFEGELKGSANFTAMGKEGKADMNVKWDAEGQSSLVGLDYKSKRSQEGTEGSVKSLHAGAKGRTQFKASAVSGKHRVKVEVDAKGKANVKAFDGNFDFAVKKQKDGSIDIPGVIGKLGEARTKGEVGFNLDTDIIGKKINKKGKVSGELKASGVIFKALNVDIKRDRDYGHSINAKASATGVDANLFNVEATRKKKGDQKEISASVIGAKVNAGNLNATGVDDRTIQAGNAEGRCSAELGNVNATLLGPKGTTSKLDANVGVQMFNVAIGMTRDTGTSASTALSGFNVNLTIGVPTVNSNSKSFGPSIGIPFIGGSGGGARSGTTDDKSNLMEYSKNEEGSNIAKGEVSGSQDGGSNLTCQGSADIANARTGNEQNHGIESDIRYTEKTSSMMANMNDQRYEQSNSSQIPIDNSEDYTTKRVLNRNEHLEYESSSEGHSNVGCVNNTGSVWLSQTENGSQSVDNTPSCQSDIFYDTSNSTYKRGTGGYSIYANDNDRENDEGHQYLATDQATSNEDITKNLSGQVYRDFEPYGKDILTDEVGLRDVIDQTDNNDMFYMANGSNSDEDEMDTFQPFTGTSGIYDSADRQNTTSNSDKIPRFLSDQFGEMFDDNVVNSKSKSGSGRHGKIQNIEEKRFCENDLCQSTREDVTGRSPFSNYCTKSTDDHDGHDLIETTRPTLFSQKHANKKTVDIADEISLDSKTIKDISTAGENCSTNYAIPFSPKVQNGNKKSSQLHESSEQGKTKLRCKESDRQHTINGDTNYDEKVYAQHMYGIEKNEKQSNMHHHAEYENSLENYMREEQIQPYESTSKCMTRGRFKESGQQLTDEEKRNKYMADLVSNQLDKSKVKYKKPKQSQGNMDSGLSIWRDKDKLKRALVEKYADDKTPSSAKTGANVGNAEGNSGQLKSKPKEKVEPKKPFGANKNIHTIFTVSGAESKPVRYLKANIACFCDE